MTSSADDVINVNDTADTAGAEKDGINANVNANEVKGILRADASKQTLKKPPIESESSEDEDEDDDNSTEEIDSDENENSKEKKRGKPCVFNPCCCFEFCCSLSSVCVNIGIFQILVSIPIFFWSDVIDGASAMLTQYSSGMRTYLKYRAKYEETVKDVGDGSELNLNFDKKYDLFQKYKNKNDTLDFGVERSGFSSNCAGYETANSIKQLLSQLMGCAGFKEAGEQFETYHTLVLVGGIGSCVAGVILVFSVACKCFLPKLGSAIGCWINSIIMLAHLGCTLASIVVLFSLLGFIFELIERQNNPDSNSHLARLFSVNVADVLAYRETILNVLIVTYVIYVGLTIYFIVCAFARGLEFRAVYAFERDREGESKYEDSDEDGDDADDDDSDY